MFTINVVKMECPAVNCTNGFVQNIDTTCQCEAVPETADYLVVMNETTWNVSGSELVRV